MSVFTATGVLSSSAKMCLFVLVIIFSLDFVCLWQTHVTSDHVGIEMTCGSSPYCTHTGPASWERPDARENGFIGYRKSCGGELATLSGSNRCSYFGV